MEVALVVFVLDYDSFRQSAQWAELPICRCNRLIVSALELGSKLGPSWERTRATRTVVQRALPPCYQAFDNARRFEDGVVRVVANRKKTMVAKENSLHISRAQHTATNKSNYI